MSVHHAALPTNNEGADPAPRRRTSQSTIGWWWQFRRPWCAQTPEALPNPQGSVSRC